MKRFLIACGLLSSGAGAAAQARLPLPYDNWGVCPFECCTYRTWTANAAIPVHAGRSDASAVVFRLRPGDTVDALTGVVVTHTPAIVRVDRRLREGYVDGSEQPQLALAPGDVVYLLTPLGEGSYRFWYKGRVYRSSLDIGALPPVRGSRLRATWWKQLRNGAGKTGWTRDDRFGNADACG